MLDHVHMIYIFPQKMKVRWVGGAEMKVMDPSVTHPLVEDDPGPPGPREPSQNVGLIGGIRSHPVPMFDQKKDLQNILEH